MTTDLAYNIALAEARSCLAALADTAVDIDESSHFEHLLIVLDMIHGDDCPALYLVARGRRDLMRRLAVAVEQMLELGADAHPG